MLGDLRTKMERHEGRAAHCAKEAQEVTDKRVRAFYDELARY